VKGKPAYEELNERIRVLEQEAEKYRSIFENAQEGIFRSLPSGRFLEVNPAFARILGYDSAEELKGEIRDIGQQLYGNPEERRKWMSVLDARDYARYEIQMFRKDGSACWVSLRGRAVRNAKGRTEYYEGFAEDITERRRAEERLSLALARAEEGERILNALMENIPEGITIADAPNLSLRMVSRYGEELLGGTLSGLTLEEVAGRWKIYHRDGAPLAAEDTPLSRAVLKGEIVKNEEVVQINEQGQALPLLCNAAPIRDRFGLITGGVAAWRDISRLKQAEAELAKYREDLETLVTLRTDQLRESENRYRTIFENTGTVTILDEADTTISLVNGEFERVFGYTKEEVEGKKSWQDLVLKEDLERLLRYRALRESKTDAAPRSYELKMVDRSGRLLDCYTTVAMIPGTNQRLASVLDITPLKEMEKALRESEMQFRVLFDRAGVGIAYLNDQGFAKVNDTFVKFTGYNREELQGMSSADITHPDSLAAHENLQRKQVRGEIDSFTLEACYVRKDGDLRWGEVISTPLRDEQGNFLSAVYAVADITERKKAESALERNEAAYRNLFENAPIGMFQSTFDPGRYLRANAAYARMLGYESPEELMATVTDIATIHVNPRDRADLLDALQQRDWYYAEYPRFRRDGSVMIGNVAIRRILKPDGTIDFIEGIVEDVTERRQAESELKKYAEEVRDLYEKAPCGYHSLGEDGTFLRMNDTELSWLGYFRDEILGRKFTDLLPPEEIGKFQQGFAAMKDRGEMRNTEGKLIRKNGEVFSVLINSTAVFDEKGQYRLCRSSVFDNTERKRAEDALAESEALYRNLFENASIGMFQTSLEGRFLRVNKAFVAMLGYESPAEVISTITDAATQIHANPGSRAELLAALERKDWFYSEQPYFRKDGSIMIGQLSIRKVVKADGTTAYLEGIVEDVTERKRAEEALIKSERETRLQAVEVVETNTTLKVLLNTMEKDQEELKERFLTNIKEQVLPYLEKLKTRPLPELEKGYVRMAEDNLNEIASPFVQKLTSSYLNLTKKEIQIAALVREGKTSKEIADLLNAKKRVIEFHRENIRAKLGLKNKKGSLAILLRSFS